MFDLDLLMMTFSRLILLAVIVEALTDTIKCTVPRKILPTRLVAFGVAVGLCFYLKLDVTELLNNQVDLLGIAVTGLIASRGSNFVSDLTKIIRLKKERFDAD